MQACLNRSALGSAANPVYLRHEVKASELLLGGMLELG